MTKGPSATRAAPINGGQETPAMRIPENMARVGARPSLPLRGKGSLRLFARAAGAIARAAGAAAVAAAAPLQVHFFGFCPHPAMGHALVVVNFAEGVKAVARCV